jgi:DNA-binding response OmpR family regulator
MNVLVVGEAVSVDERPGAAQADEPSPPCRLGDVELDTERREGRVNGHVIKLRAKEFDLLRAFIEHVGSPLSRERLLSLVWGYEIPGKTRTVDVHVNHLRRKLHGSRLEIQTLRRVGYRLVEHQG